MCDSITVIGELVALKYVVCDIKTRTLLIKLHLRVIK